MSTESEVADQYAFTEALADIRDDACDINLVVVGHVDGNPNLVNIVHKGPVVDDLSSVLRDDEVMYLLARVTSTYDMSETVKFIYVHWVGKKVPIGMKGRYGVVHRSVREKLGAYHIELETDTTEDLTEAIFKQKVEETSGKISKVLESTEGRQHRGFTSSQITKTHGGQRSTTSSKVMAPSKQGAPVAFSPELADALTDIREDSSPSNWLLAGYEGGNPKNELVVLGSGTGGLAEMKEALQNDLVLYGLLRVSDQVDDITTTKFVYIMWVGEKVKPMTKAKVATHKGSLEEMFKPAHVTVYAYEQSDLRQQTIMDKVTSASGTKSHVTERRS